jgi:hypothetical protein
MSSRTDALVAQFVQNHNDLVNLLQHMPAEDWQKVPAGEQRPAGVIAYHTAQGYLATLAFAQMLAHGQALPPLTPAALEQMNTRQAAEHAEVTREEVLALLEANCGAVTAGLHDLSDEQLDAERDFFGRKVTVEAVVAGLVINHVREHSASIRSIGSAL